MSVGEYVGNRIHNLSNIGLFDLAALAARVPLLWREHAAAVHMQLDTSAFFVTSKTIRNVQTGTGTAYKVRPGPAFFPCG